MCVATLALVGAGIGAAGKLLGGVSSAHAASYQAQVARNNAVVAQQNAAYAASAGASQTEQAGLKARSRDAAVRASLAANGVDVNTGSAADVQVSSRELGQLDTATVANNAALEAYGYRTQATNYTAQAGLEQSQVVPDVLGGVLGAAGSFLGNSSVDGGLSSLMGKNPSLGEDYQWMQGGGGDSGGYVGPMA